MWFMRYAEFAKRLLSNSFVERSARLFHAIMMYEELTLSRHLYRCVKTLIHSQCYWIVYWKACCGSEECMPVRYDSRLYFNFTVAAWDNFCDRRRLFVVLRYNHSTHACMEFDAYQERCAWSAHLDLPVNGSVHIWSASFRTSIWVLVDFVPTFRYVTDMSNNRDVYLSETRQNAVIVSRAFQIWCTQSHND